MADVIEPGTDKRPRSILRWVTYASLLFGIIVSGYLSYVKLTDVPMACTVGGVFNCEAVQNSVYSRVFNIPIAWFGLGMYLTLALLHFLQPRVAFLRANGMMLIFGITLFGTIYSAYLVYVQFQLLQALCMWCLMHEANMFFALMPAVALRLRKYLAGDDLA
jgi:uncharacterized membrane protein